jgi:hypothetical protein
MAIGAGLGSHIGGRFAWRDRLRGLWNRLGRLALATSSEANGDKEKKDE